MNETPSDQEMLLDKMLADHAVREWRQAIRQAEKREKGKKGDFAPLVSLLRDGEGDIPRDAGRIVAQFLSLLKWTYKANGTPSSMIDPQGSSDQQILLRMAADEYQEEKVQLERWLELPQERRKKARLEKALANLLDTIVANWQEEGLTKETFENHLKHRHGPSNRAKAKKV